MNHPQFDLEGGQCFELRYSPASRLTALFTDFAAILESPSTLTPLNVEAAELYERDHTQVLPCLKKSYIWPPTLLFALAALTREGLYLPLTAAGCLVRLRLTMLQQFPCLSHCLGTSISLCYSFMCFLEKCG